MAASQISVIVTPEDNSRGQWRAKWSAVWEGWLIFGHAALIDGRLCLIDLHLQLDNDYGTSAPEYPPGAITTTVVRQIPVGAILSEIRAWIIEDHDLEATAEEWGFEFEQLTKQRRRRRAEAARTPRALGRGRPPLSDEHLAEVALYRLHLEEQGVRNVYAALSKRFGKTEKTMKEHIREARRRGFLAPAVQGARGAAPGPNLHKVSENRSSDE